MDQMFEEKKSNQAAGGVFVWWGILVIGSINYKICVFDI